MTLAFRSPRDLDDRKLIADAWARSLRGEESAGIIDERSWMSVAVPQAMRYIDRPSTTTLIAYEDESWAESADVYGFITADVGGPVAFVYFVFVKKPYRRRGFARALFAAAGVQPTSSFRYLCRTRISDEIAAAGKIPRAKFDPVSVRKERET